MPADDPPPPPRGFESEFDAEGLNDALQPESLEPSYQLDEEEPPLFPPQGTRPHPPRQGMDDDYEPQRPPRSYAGLIKLAVIGCVIGVLLALFSWQWPNISHFVARMSAKTPTQTTQAPTPDPKLAGRVPQEQAPGQPPGTGTPGNQTAPAVAQRVVLYEEDPNDPQGRRFVGSAIWRTETVSPGPGLAPELAVRADIEIPDRRMTVTAAARRSPACG
jgi:hypothetical protein